MKQEEETKYLKKFEVCPVPKTSKYPLRLENFIRLTNEQIQYKVKTERSYNISLVFWKDFCNEIYGKIAHIDNKFTDNSTFHIFEENGNIWYELPETKELNCTKLYLLKRYAKAIYIAQVKLKKVIKIWQEQNVLITSFYLK